MRTRSALLAAGAATLLGPPVVHADLILQTPEGQVTATPYTGDFHVYGDGDRGLRTGTPAVRDDDHASLSLKMFTPSGDNAYINAGEEVLVQRGPDYTSLGENVTTGYDIEATWDEFVGDLTNTVQVIWRTNRESEFLPSGTMIGDEEAVFLGWRLGALDPIDFRPWIDSVDIVRAIVAFSDDGGQTFTTFDITDAFLEPWDGTDFGITLALVGTDTNVILTQYEYEAVPAPGVASLLAVAGLATLRRRR